MKEIVKIDIFSIKKNAISPMILINKGFKGTVVNLECPCLI